MNLILKYLLFPLLLLLTALPLQAEEKSWYEIDGIRIRQGQNFNQLVIYMPWYIESQISPFFSGSPQVGAITGIRGEKNLFPFALELPETLMTSWSYRGGQFDFEFPTEHDLRIEVNEEAYDGRLKSSYKTSLYNDFFNASDKTFADANSNWALSADVTSSRVFLGYYWGVFIPAFEYHRFAKIGLGLGAFYAELSYKLNLCSQYKVTPVLKGGEVDTGHGGECVGKTEIDSASAKGFGVATIIHLTFWERVTKDSIWKIYSGEIGENLTDTADALKLKNHDKNLSVSIGSSSIELISYTYRF